jgi:hypothetical protein
MQIYGEPLATHFPAPLLLSIGTAQCEARKRAATDFFLSKYWFAEIDDCEYNPSGSSIILIEMSCWKIEQMKKKYLSRCKPFSPRPIRVIIIGFIN